MNGGIAMELKKTKKEVTVAESITVIREGANTTMPNNTDCAQHGGNCCASGYCCNHKEPDTKP